MAVERKYERDIDVFLAEEFSVSAPFADWFRSHTRFHNAPAKVVDVFVSRFDDTGESDLVVIFQCDDGDRFSIHIEDKIDAAFQPNQAERYHARARAETANGLYGDYAVVLCAPENYCNSVAPDPHFDAIVSYEAISAALLSIDDCIRTRYRAEFVATAARRSANAWVKVEDEATKEFWSAAHDLAEREFPILEMKPRDLTKNSAWITLRPADMPTKPKLIYIDLKGYRGHVDLLFTKTSFPVFSSLIAPLLEEGMVPAPASASCAVRLKTPAFTVQEGLDFGLPKVRDAFAAAERLVLFYRRNREALDKIAAATNSPTLKPSSDVDAR